VAKTPTRRHAAAPVVSVDLGRRIRVPGCDRASKRFNCQRQRLPSAGAAGQVHGRLHLVQPRHCSLEGEALLRTAQPDLQDGKVQELQDSVRLRVIISIRVVLKVKNMRGKDVIKPCRQAGFPSQWRHPVHHVQSGYRPMLDDEKNCWSVCCKSTLLPQCKGTLTPPHRQLWCACDRSNAAALCYVSTQHATCQGWYTGAGVSSYARRQQASEHAAHTAAGNDLAACVTGTHSKLGLTFGCRLKLQALQINKRLLVFRACRQIRLQSVA